MVVAIECLLSQAFYLCSVIYSKNIFYELIYSKNIFYEPTMHWALF